MVVWEVFVGPSWGTFVAGKNLLLTFTPRSVTGPTVIKVVAADDGDKERPIVHHCSTCKAGPQLQWPGYMPVANGQLDTVVLDSHVCVKKPTGRSKSKGIMLKASRNA